MSPSQQQKKASTKARREGYAVLNRLRHLLCAMFYGRKYMSDFDVPSSYMFISEFEKLGWRDFMVKYLPTDKRGGPATQKSKRKKQKKKDRQNTIR